MWRAGDGPSLLEKDGCGPRAVGGDPRMASSWGVRAGTRNLRQAGGKGERRGGREQPWRWLPTYWLGFSLKVYNFLLLLLKQIVLMSPRHAF